MKNPFLFPAVLIFCGFLHISMARDADPWVTRHNLNGLTRIIVTQFSSDFSAAYDANHCRLYQVWPGKILFGAVPYVPPMNPRGSKSQQPESVGDRYFRSKNQTAWTLFQNGEEAPLEVRLGGYRFFEDYQNVTFWYELKTQDGKILTVEETPDGGITSEKPWMERKFKVEGLSSGQKLELNLEGDPAANWSVTGDASLNGSACSFAQNGTSVVKAQWNTVLSKPASSSKPQSIREPLAKSSADRWKPVSAYSIDSINGIDDLVVGGMTSLSGDRIAVSTWDNIQAVYIIQNLESNPVSTRFAAGFHEPLGLLSMNDTIYVMEKQQLTRLIDTNKDQKADVYENICDDWVAAEHYHNFTFGLENHNGEFFTVAAFSAENGSNTRHSGTFLRMNPQTHKATVMSSGLRVPNGFMKSFDNEFFVTDNQGSWRPSNLLIHLEEGKTYGHYPSRFLEGEPEPLFLDQEPSPPALYLTHGSLSKSPGEPVIMTEPPYEGHFLIPEATFNDLNRGILEKVNGQYQGAIISFGEVPRGVNRIVPRGNGTYYLGRVGHVRWLGRYSGLYKMQLNNDIPKILLNIRLQGNEGFELDFSYALDPSIAAKPENFHLEKLKYQPTEKYGGKPVDLGDIQVTKVEMKNNNKTIRLYTQGLEEGTVVEFDYNHEELIGMDGKGPDKMIRPNAFYTLNRFGYGEPVNLGPVARQMQPTGTLAEIYQVSGKLKLETFLDNITLDIFELDGKRIFSQKFTNAGSHLLDRNHFGFSGNTTFFIRLKSDSKTQTRVFGLLNSSK